MGAVLVALALVWTPSLAALAFGDSGDLPAESALLDPTGAESSIRESFTLGFKIGNTKADRSKLDLRGTRSSGGNSGPFRANMTIHSVPCPGEYFFSGGQENTRNGNSMEYLGLLRLYGLEMSPASARCGIAVPPRSGKAEVSLGMPERLIFDLSEAERTNDGAFGGKLTFRVFPPCGTYRLRIALDLTGWRRSVNFKVQVIEFEATYQGGRRVPKQSC